MTASEATRATPSHRKRRCGAGRGHSTSPSSGPNTSGSTDTTSNDREAPSKVTCELTTPPIPAAIRIAAAAAMKRRRRRLGLCRAATAARHPLDGARVPNRRILGGAGRGEPALEGRRFVEPGAEGAVRQRRGAGAVGEVAVVPAAEIGAESVDRRPEVGILPCVAFAHRASPFSSDASNWRSRRRARASSDS